MDFAAEDPAERRGETARAGGERTPRCAQRMSRAKSGTAKVERTPRRAQRMSRAKSGTAKVEIAGPLKLEANTVPRTRKELQV